MTDTVSAFISELIRAANQVEKLTKLERTRLFQRASVSLRDMDGPADMAGLLSEYGRLSDGLTDSEISAALLEAVTALKSARRAS